MQNQSNTQLVSALRLLQQGHWEQAHEIVQNLNTPLACRIHALLHRIEGDNGNAGYWYRRAGVSFPNQTVEDETHNLIAEMKTVE